MNLMPVFHDDQHGTSIAALSAFINSVKLAEKVGSECKVVINGAGAAGLSIA
jgi:malate dehydrogenase (oxaloacetate-decarboxylating)